LLTVPRYAVDRRGPSAVSNYGGPSASQWNSSASSTNYPSTPSAHIHLVFLLVKCLQPDFDTILHHTALDVQQRLGPRRTRAGPDASTAALRVRCFMRMGFSERGEYGRGVVRGCFVSSSNPFPSSSHLPFSLFIPFLPLGTLLRRTSIFLYLSICITLEFRRH
jgi:hypothetical protein